MSQITTTITLPCTIADAMMQIPVASFVRVVHTHGKEAGVTNAETVARAGAFGLAHSSVSYCMWDLPTWRTPVYTATHCITRTPQGYTVQPIAHNTPTQMVAWEQVERALPVGLADVLTQLAQVVHDAGAQLYVVGGAVRSILQKEPITDLDVAIHGDMAVIGPAMARQLNTTIIQRSAFDTATLAMPADVATHTGVTYLDLVPLRTEIYAYPGALPTVAPTTSIVVDLGRRDITLNAMAIAYQPHAPMPLYDPFAGAVDLHKRRARVLHPLSMIDDPTRIVRIARLMIRLQLTTDGTSRRAIRWAVASHVIGRVSRQRWMQEMQRTLDEVHPQAVFGLLKRWGVLAQIDRALTHGVAPEVHQLPSEWRILAVIWRAPLHQLAHLMMEWTDAAKPLRGIVYLRQTRRRWRHLLSAPPSQIGAYVRQFDRRLLQHVGVLEPMVARLLARVDSAQSTMTPMYVRGGDLIRLGVMPGPQVGRLLQVLNDALLDGVHDLHTVDAQVAWLKTHRLWS